MNNKASAINQIGLEFLLKKDFSNAFKKFQAACGTCTQNFSHRQTFEINKQEAYAEVLNDEGEKLSALKKFMEAQKKFTEALNLCPAEKTATRDRIKNKKASAFNIIGIQFWNEKKYATAKANFKSAFELSNNQDHKAQ